MIVLYQLLEEPEKDTLKLAGTFSGVQGDFFAKVWYPATLNAEKSIVTWNGHSMTF